MNLTKISAAIGIIALAVGCSTFKSRSRDEWRNIYYGDPSVMKINVTQYPENPYEMKGYAGRHPAVVEYSFEDETKRVITYLPDGEVISDYYFDRNGERLK